MLNELSVAQNERGKEVSLAILIMVLHKLFEFATHVLCAHVWRVCHHCRVFASEIPCLSKYVLCMFTQKWVEQRIDVIRAFRC